MPKGYFFVEVEIADPAAYEAYRTTVPDIIAAHKTSHETRCDYRHHLIW